MMGDRVDVEASTIPAPAMPCCGEHQIAAVRNLRVWVELGLIIGECACGSTRTAGEVAL